MNLLKKVKFVILRKLGSSLGLPNLEIRLQTLELHAKDVDSREEKLNSIFDEAAEALVKTRSHQKLNDIHFQTLFDQVEIEADRLTAFIEDFNEYQEKLKDELAVIVSQASEKHNEVNQMISALTEKINAKNSDIKQQVSEVTLKIEDQNREFIDRVSQLTKDIHDAEKNTQDKLLKLEAWFENCDRKLTAEINSILSQLKNQPKSKSKR